MLPSLDKKVISPTRSINSPDFLNLFQEFMDLTRKNYQRNESTMQDVKEMKEILKTLKENDSKKLHFMQQQALNSSKSLKFQAARYKLDKSEKLVSQNPSLGSPVRVSASSVVQTPFKSRGNLLITPQIQISIQAGSKPQQSSPLSETNVVVQQSATITKQSIKTSNTKPTDSYDELLPQFEQMNQSAKNGIRCWVGMHLQKMSERIFDSYLGGKLSDTETKVQYSKSLLILYHKFCGGVFKLYPDFWKKEKAAIVLQFEDSVKVCLQYLLVKYPQKPKTEINREVLQSIKPFDLSSRIQFRMLNNLENQKDSSKQELVSIFQEIAACQKLKPKSGFSRVIELILNRFITSAQQNLPRFKQVMKEIFYVDSTHGDGQGVTLPHLIGMKFRQNTPLFKVRTREQQLTMSEVIEIRSPEVLRVLIKWADQLEQRMKTDKILNEGIDFYNKQGEYVDLSLQQIRDMLNEMKQEHLGDIKQFQSKLQTAFQEMKMALPQYCSIKAKDVFGYIDESQSITTLSSYTLSEEVSIFFIKYLNLLINALTRQKGQDNPSLVTFSVFDLLRAKCTGTIDQLVTVFRQLQSSPDFTIVRVKDRLDTSNKDILVNMRLTGTPIICEVQLGLKIVTNPKQESSDHFNHFLYQFQRSKFGPLTEAALIISHNSDMVPFFRKKILKSKRMQIATQPLKLEVSLDQEMTVNGVQTWKEELVLICQSCKQVKTAQIFRSTFYLKDLGFVCGMCIYKSLDQTSKKRILLPTLLQPFFYEMKTRNNKNPPKIVLSFSDLSTNQMQIFYRLQLKTLVFWSFKQYLKPGDQPVTNLYVQVTSGPKAQVNVRTLQQIFETSYINWALQPTFQAFITKKQEISSYRSLGDMPIQTLQKLFGNYSIDSNWILTDIQKKNLVPTTQLQKYTKDMGLGQDDKKQALSIVSMQQLTTELCSLLFLDPSSPNTLVHLSQFNSETDDYRLTEAYRARLRRQNLRKLLTKNPTKIVLLSQDLNDQALEDLFRGSEIRASVKDITLDYLNIMNPYQTFSKLKNLQSLKIANNTVHMAELDFGKLQNLFYLSHLIITNNFVEAIKGLDMLVDSLKVVRISLTTTNCIQFGEAQFKHLEELSLNNNGLKQLDLGAAKFPKIRILNLSGNQFKFLWLANTIVPQTLEVINLSSNQLTESSLDARFKSKLYPVLRVLNLSKNKLQELDFSGSQFPSLVEVDVRENNQLKLIGLNSQSKEDCYAPQLNRLLQ